MLYTILCNGPRKIVHGYPARQSPLCSLGANASRCRYGLLVLVAPQYIYSDEASALISGHYIPTDYPEKAATLRVSFVDARHPSLASRAILGVEALRGPVPRSSLRNARTAVNFARAFQEVLVYGQIPPEAVLVTVPWTKFKTLFHSTHLICLADDVDCRNSFRYFCERLMMTLLGRDADLAKTVSVDQSMVILGQLYAEVKDESDLDRIREIVCDLSRIIFSWPYRHPSYHDKSYRMEKLAPVDHAFPHLKRTLLDIVEKHPSHRRAAILLRITDLKEEITDFATRSTHPMGVVSIPGSSDLGHKKAVQLHLRALKDVLLKTSSIINTLEETLAEEASVADLSER